jgi:hypothetical protein
MKKIWKPTLFFVTCLVVFIAINMPVVLILGQLKLPASIIFHGVTGQLNSGQIEELNANRFPIQDIRYQADLSCLFKFTICYQIDYQNGRAHVSFNLLSSKTEISELDVEYSLADLTPLMSQLLVIPTGELNLKFDQIMIDQNKIGQIEGIAIWSDAGIEGEAINLGDYQLDINSEDKSYKVELKDNNATLDIDGNGRLNSDGQYLLDIKIVAKSSLDSGIKSVLELVAKKKGLYEYNLSRQGRLPRQFVDQLAFSDNK